MWQYKCPVCGKVIEEDKTKEQVKKLITKSHRCPECGNLLYVNDKFGCYDLAEMLRRALELATGIIITREEALAGYHEF